MVETSAGELAGQVRLAVVRLNRRLRAHPADSAVTPAARAALGTLHTSGPMSPGELARAEHVSPPAMTRVLALLEGQQLVSRSAHPTDGRQSIVAASPAGSALILEIRAREAWLTARIKSLSGPERSALVTALPVLHLLAEPDVAPPT